MDETTNPSPTTCRTAEDPHARRSRSHLAPIALVLLGALALGQAGGLVPPIADWPAAMLAGLADIPLWAFVLAFVLLPALGFPLLAFYFSVGAMTDSLTQALLIAWICMAGNMAVSYLVARQLARPLRRLAERRGYRIPHLEPPDDWKVIVMMRTSPLPWLMQSYLLTLGGARFWRYMLFGLPVQTLVGLGVILLGDSVLRGNAKWALIAVFLILAASLIRTAIRRRGRSGLQSADTTPLESA